MIEYVCGFLFSTGRKTVALIRKSDKHHEKWQDGQLNGLGGKVKESEGYLEAMNREFDEEGGVRGIEWNKFLTLEVGKGSVITVHFFRAFSDLVTEVKTMEDESVGVFRLEDIIGASNPLRTIPNLQWIIPLALDTQLEQSVVRIN